MHQLTDEEYEALNAKAKLGEAEIREAKREMLEEIRGHSTDWIEGYIDSQLAALKRAGK